MNELAIRVLSHVGKAWRARDASVVELEPGRDVRTSDTLWLDGAAGSEVLLEVGGTLVARIRVCGGGVEIVPEPEADWIQSLTKTIGAVDWWDGHFGRQVVIRVGDEDVEFRVLRYQPGEGVVPPPRPPGLNLEVMPQAIGPWQGGDLIVTP